MNSNAWYIQRSLRALNECRMDMTPLEKAHADAAQAWHLSQVASQAAMACEESDIEKQAREFEITAFQDGEKKTGAALELTTDPEQIRKIQRMLQLAIDSPIASRRHPQQAINSVGRLRNYHQQLAIGRFQTPYMTGDTPEQLKKVTSEFAR